MNRAVVGQASRLPLGRLAPGFVAGETPAKTAGTAAPRLPRPCSWSHCAQIMAWGLAMNHSLKSGSKLHALQTLRAGMWLVHFAKRLECVRLAGVLGVQSAKSSFGEFSPQGVGESLSALGNSLLKDLAQLGNWLFPVLGERVSSLLKNVWFAAWGHAAYKISSEISMPCRPGALTGRLFQRALKARASISSNLICGVVPMKQCHTRRRENS